MKLQLFFVSLLIVSMNAFAVDKPKSDSDINWQPVYGSPTGIFINKDSIEHMSNDSGNFAEAMVLIVMDSPKTEKIEGKAITFKSMVHIMVAECNSARIGTFVDFYFSVKKPTKKTLPIKTVSFDTNLNSFQQLDKDSFIYKTFCPTSI